MTLLNLDEQRQESSEHGVQTQNLGWLRLLDPVREHGFLPLLCATILVEVACNMVHVALLERVYELVDQATAVGGLLVIQTLPQVFLGMSAGAFVDHVGKRRAAMIATVAYAALAALLVVVGHSAAAVYVLALLVMLVRLVIIPARLALVSDISGAEHLMVVNSVIAVATAVAAVLGPAISVTLILLTASFEIVLVGAGLGLLLSALSLKLIPPSAALSQPNHTLNFWQEMRSGWHLVRDHSLVREVFRCLVIFTVMTGAIMPLITPLAHQLGLGSEGTGIFLSVLGLGGLAGAPLALLVFRLLSPAGALILTGALVPAGVLAIGLGNSLEGVLVALALTAVSGASLNLIAITVLQGLIPSEQQGTVFGIEQTLLGVAWLVGLVATTGGVAVQPADMNIQALFLQIGGIGLLFFAIYSSWHWHRLEAACIVCEPPSPRWKTICEQMCKTGLHVSGTVCRIICSNPLRYGY